MTSHPGELVSVVRLPTGIRRLFVLATVALSLAGCSGQAEPTPTPDLFAGVAEQADQAFNQGMDLYQAGQYRKAQDAFNRARLFSPSSDPRIEDMIRRTNEQLTPTATPAPPTATPTSAPTPVVISEATPYPEFSQAYFGKTFLAVVPGQDGSAVPMSRYSTQDQIGLYLEKLDERLHLAYTLRVFDTDAGNALANVTGDDVQRFTGRFVWYHSGGEPVGHFRVELYAGDVLANTFDYEVGSEPVAIPTPVVEATPVPVPSDTALPVLTPAPTPVVAPPAPAPPVAAPPPTLPPSRPAPPPAPPPPTPVLPPVASATRISMPGGPSALAYDDVSDDLFVADRSGLIWPLRHGDLALSRPFSVTGVPVGLAVDSAGQRLYAAVAGQPAVLVLDSSSGQQLASTALAVDPGDIRFDPASGYLYIVLPQNDSLQVIDTHDLHTVTVTASLPHVTGLAFDQARRTLYLSQLDGQIDVVNASGEVTARWIASGEGLAALAVRDDQVFAVNSSEKVLIQGNLSTGEATRTQLDVEPAAVDLGRSTGAVYVLGVDADAVLKLDGPTTTRIPLGDDGPVAASDLSAQTAWVRPRMVTSPGDERLYVIEPEASVLAVAPPGT